MPKVVQFTPEQELEICRLYTSSGLTITDLIRRFNCSATPILRVLRDKDVPMRPQGDPMKRNRNDKILDMSDKGYSNGEIAKTFGVSRQRIHQIVSRGY